MIDLILHNEVKPAVNQIENLNIFVFKLTDEDMALMSTLDRNEAAYDDRAVDIVKWISGTRIHD